MHYNISGRKWKAGNLAYKTGKSFTKWESCLQNRNLIYKAGLLDYKRDSRLAIYQKQVPYLQNEYYLIDDINYIVYTNNGKVDFKKRYLT